MTDFLSFLEIVSSGFGLTVLLTVSGFAIGAVAAIPLAWARMSSLAPLAAAARIVIAAIRGIPIIAWVFLIFFGLGQTALAMPKLPAAIVAFSLISAGYLAETYRAGYLSVPTGQFEAVRALGMTRLDGVVQVTLPQSFSVIVPGSISFLIGLFKDTAIASVIGVAEITERAMYLSRREEDTLLVFFAAGVLYLIVSIPIGFLGRWIGPRLSKRMAVAS